MHLKRWIAAGAVLAAAFAAAFVIPTTRELAYLNTSEFGGSFKDPSFTSGSSDWLTHARVFRDEVLARHKDDPEIILGLIPLIGRRDESRKLVRPLLATGSTDPSVHAGALDALVPIEWAGWTSSAKDVLSPQDIALTKSEIRWGMKHDPDNGLFPLLDAADALISGDIGRAIPRYVRASQSKRVDTYWRKRKEATFTALISIGVSRPQALFAFASLAGDRLSGIAPMLAKRVSEEARSAEAAGRKTDALRLQLATFRLGSLMAKAGGDQQRALGVMLRTTPKERPATPGLSIEGRFDQIIDHLQANGLSVGEASTMRSEMLSVYRRERAQWQSICTQSMIRTWDLYIVLSLFILAALRYGILALATYPFAKLLGRGDASPRGWSAATSAVLWVLLLTPAVPLILHYESPSPVLAMLSWFALMPVGPNPLVMFVPPLVGALAAIGIGTFAEWIMRRRGLDATRLPWIAASALTAVVWVLWAAMFGGDGSSATGIVTAVLTMIPVAAFALVRGGIVSHRAPGRGFWAESITGLLIAFRSIALGSLVIFVLGIYLIAPTFSRAMDVYQQYVLNSM